jgi:hypothetical protein
MSQTLLTAREWQRSGPTHHWSLHALCETVNYAAARILDRIPDDIPEWDKDGNELLHETNALVTLLREAMTHMLQLHENLGTFKHDGFEYKKAHIAFCTAISTVYITSFRVQCYSMHANGSARMDEWMPEFKEHQAVLSSAYRYLNNIAM